MVRWGYGPTRRLPTQRLAPISFRIFHDPVSVHGSGGACSYARHKQVLPGAVTLLELSPDRSCHQICQLNANTEIRRLQE